MCSYQKLQTAIEIHSNHRCVEQTNISVIGSSSAVVKANQVVERIVVVVMTTKHAPVVVLVTHDVNAAYELVAGTDDRCHVHFH